MRGFQDDCLTRGRWRYCASRGATSGAFPGFRKDPAGAARARRYNLLWGRFIQLFQFHVYVSAIMCRFPVGQYQTGPLVSPFCLASVSEALGCVKSNRVSRSGRFFGGIARNRYSQFAACVWAFHGLMVCRSVIPIGENQSEPREKVQQPDGRCSRPEVEALRAYQPKTGYCYVLSCRLRYARSGSIGQDSRTMVNALCFPAGVIGSFIRLVPGGPVQGRNQSGGPESQ